MKRDRLIVIISAVVFFSLLAALLVYMAKTPVKQSPGSVNEQKTGEGTMTVKVFLPDESRLILEVRVLERVFSQKKVLKSAMTEFLKGSPALKRNIIPVNSILLGVYVGNDGITYIDLSEDFKRNFHGDALDEFLLLRGLYETAASNANIEDMKILIDHKETDTIGGHFAADRPLKLLVKQELSFE